MYKKIALVVGLVIVVGGASFYGGMKYGQNKSSVLASAQRQARFEQMGGGANRTGRSGSGAGGGFVNGEIVTVSDQNLTVKINTDGSKVVFFTTTTPISKSVNGGQQDLTVGQQVMISGTANSDGSVSAQNIQIRPAGPAQPVQK